MNYLLMSIWFFNQLKVNVLFEQCRIENSCQVLDFVKQPLIYESTFACFQLTLFKPHKNRNISEPIDWIFSILSKLQFLSENWLRDSSHAKYDAKFLYNL